MATAFGQRAQVFRPTQISGCQLWLDSSDSSTLTTSGTAVSQWNDKSGSGNNATATGTIRTTGSINGKIALNWTGSVSTYFQGALVNSGTTLTAFSVFTMNSSSYIVARILSLGKPGFNDYDNIAYAAAISRNSTKFEAFRAGSSRSQVNAIFGSPVLICSQFDGTNHTIYLNGTGGPSVASSGSFNFTNYEVGTDFNEEALVPLNGQIGEVVYFSGSLTTLQRQQIEGYLAWKWGLQGNLPSTHPYKNIPLYQLPPLPLVPAPRSITNSKPGPSRTFPTRNTQGKSYFIDTPLWYSFGIPTSNFSSALPITLAGNSSYTGNILQLTPNAASQRGSAFFQRQLRIINFSTQFNLRFDSTQADGATFCIQNSSSNALGAVGGGLGYSGVGSSVAIRFDSYNGAGGNFSTDVLTGGSVTPDLAGSGVLNTTFGLTAGTTWNFLIAIAYNGTTLSYTIRNFNNLNQSFTSNRTINLGTTIGSSNAWIGFTSATGGATEVCSILSWNWSNSKL